MKTVDVQLVVAVISTVGVVVVALYNGWVNSKRSREERTTPSYQDLLEQVRDATERVESMRSAVDQLEKDRGTMRETITELKQALADEKAARDEIREETAQFIDAIGRYALGQAKKPVLPKPIADHIDQDLWRQVPEEERRFRLPGEDGRIA